MAASLARLVAGLRRGGLTWLRHALRTELRSPQFAVTGQVRRAAAGIDRGARGMLRRIAGPSMAGPARRRRRLLFVLDLDAVPLTFDIATYLAGAEIARRAADQDSIFVVIVPGRHQGVRAEDADYGQVVDVADRRWRLRHLVIPCLALLPSVSGYVVCDDRREADRWLDAGGPIYPPGYLSALPNQPALRHVRDAAASGVRVWPLFAAEPAALRRVERFFGEIASGRRPITISLRRYGYNPGRNSDLAAWLDFADSIGERGYAPIFVPDLEESLGSGGRQFGDHPVCAAAAWSVSLRMALYQSAFLNLGLMHGPMELCWYNERARYLIFMPLGAALQTSPEYLTRQGFRIGEDFAFATPHQHLVWESDRSDAIAREFARMVERLSG